MKRNNKWAEESKKKIEIYSRHRCYGKQLQNWQIWNRPNRDPVQYTVVCANTLGITVFIDSTLDSASLIVTNIDFRNTTQVRIHWTEFLSFAVLLFFFISILFHKFGFNLAINENWVPRCGGHKKNKINLEYYTHQFNTKKKKNRFSNKGNRARETQKWTKKTKLLILFKNKINQN